jgi:predicted ester cyclase
MSTETNTAIVRRFIEQALNEHRVGLVEEFVTEDIVGGIKQGAAVAFNAFPDFQLTIDDEIAGGDKVVFRYRFRGTHQGELMGIPGTGNQVTLSGVAIYRLANSRIVEFWNFPDNLSLMQQLGAVPTPDRQRAQGELAH